MIPIQFRRMKQSFDFLYVQGFWDSFGCSKFFAKIIEGGLLDPILLHQEDKKSFDRYVFSFDGGIFERGGSIEAMKIVVKAVTSYRFNVILG